MICTVGTFESCQSHVYSFGPNHKHPRRITPKRMLYFQLMSAQTPKWKRSIGAHVKLESAQVMPARHGRCGFWILLVPTTCCCYFHEGAEPPTVSGLWILTIKSHYAVSRRNEKEESKGEEGRGGNESLSAYNRVAFVQNDNIHTYAVQYVKHPLYERLVASSHSFIKIKDQTRHSQAQPVGYKDTRLNFITSIRSNFVCSFFSLPFHTLRIVGLTTIRASLLPETTRPTIQAGWPSNVCSSWM